MPLLNELVSNGIGSVMVLVTGNHVMVTDSNLVESASKITGFVIKLP